MTWQLLNEFSVLSAILETFAGLLAVYSEHEGECSELAHAYLSNHERYLEGANVFAIAYFTGSPDSDYLFPAYQNSTHKTHVSRQAAHKVLREVVELVPELEGISTHSFRRSFATNLQKTGRTAAEIKRLLGGRLLGHRSVGMMARYIG